MIEKESDLTGKTFGRLTVIERVDDYIYPNGVHKARWKCQCNCEQKTFINIRADHLLKMETQSCGCLKKESASNNFKKYNDYEIQEDYVIMYTQKGEPFFVDLEDFWKVRDICWHIDKNGYLTGIGKCKKIVYLHRVIMDCPPDGIIDHINGDKTNNRKINLRTGTQGQNNINKGIKKNNKSGAVGVCWIKRTNKWQAYIGFNGKRIHLGYFDNFDNAIKARKEAENKYFGEWSYDNSQKIGGHNGI